MTSPRLKEFDGDYRRQPKTDRYCTYCQRDIKPNSLTRTVQIVNEHFILHPEDTSTYNGTIQRFIVGADCAQKIGLEWTLKGEL